MIDWIKGSVRDASLIKRLVLNSKLNPKGKYCVNSGIVDEYPIVAKDNEFKFELKSPDYLEITGSLHKYFANGRNDNDFTYSELVAAIDSFCRQYGIDGKSLFLHNLEFGVNIQVTIPIKQLMNDIICYKNETPEKRTFNNKGLFYEFPKSDYYLKIYDKGKQYHLISNLLRIEIKAIKQRFIEYAGVRCLSDLKEHNSLIALSSKLLEIFEQIVFDDSSINPKSLKTTERKLYECMKNPKEWETNKMHKNGTIRARERSFITLIGKHGKHQYSKRLKKQIEEKYNLLLPHRN